MHCPSCMAENVATRRFCAECGSPLPSPCPACGFENEPTAKFCGGCGKPIGEVAAPAPTAVPAPLQQRRFWTSWGDCPASSIIACLHAPEERSQ
jgi:predicted amidophosphoribosyltransferase